MTRLVLAAAVAASALSFAPAHAAPEQPCINGEWCQSDGIPCLTIGFPPRIVACP